MPKRFNTPTWMRDSAAPLKGSRTLRDQREGTRAVLVRLDLHQLQLLDECAQARDLSREAMIRALLAEGLSADGSNGTPAIVGQRRRSGLR